MASRAAVLIDLSVADATPVLRETATAAHDAADGLEATESGAKAASRAIREHAKEQARVGRALRDYRVVEAAAGAERAAALIREAHGADIAALAERRLADQIAAAAAKSRQAADAHETQVRAVKALDRAVDSLGKRTGELGGDLARFGGQMDVLGEAGRPITLLGDAIELMSSPLGAAVGLTAAWGAALGGAIAGSVALVAASDDLIERLELIGQADVITPEQTEQLRVARASLTAVSDAWALIATTIAANVGPQVEQAAALLVGASLQAGSALKVVAGSVDLLSVAVNVLTGGLASQLELVASALNAVQGFMAKLSPTAKIALNVATGGMAGLIEAAAGAADTLGGVVERVREQGREWIRATDAARTASEAVEVGMTAAGKATRAAADDTDRYASDLERAAEGLQAIIDAATADTLDPAAKALRDFAAQMDKIAKLDLGPELSGLVEQAGQAVQAGMFRVLDDIRAQEKAALDAFASLPAASAVALDAIAAARRATAGSVAGEATNIAGMLGGNIGAGLSALGPGGMILGAAIELGPDTVGLLDDRLSEIGDTLIHLPETLAKVLATIVGFGADNAGEGVGRGLGAVLGGTIGFLVGGGPAGAVAGAALGSAAGGAIGNAASGERTRSEVAARRNMRRAGSSVTINGIVTTDVLRTLDREAKIKGGSRGLRMQLAAP